MIFCDVLEDGGEEDRDSDYEEIDDSYINEEEVASIAHRLLNQKQMKAAIERPKTPIITENSASRSTTPPEPPHVHSTRATTTLSRFNAGKQATT